jgi:fucose permease
MKQLEPYDLFFLETPLQLDNVEGYAYLHDHSPIRIAAGELQNSRFEFLDLMDRGKVDVAQEVLRRRAFYGICLAILLHGIYQVGMVAWVGQLFRVRSGIDAAQSAYFISSNSIGFFIGRSVLTWITSRRPISDLLLMGICASGGTISFAATCMAGGYWTGLLAFAIAGAFVSGVGPATNALTGRHFPEHAATAFALMNGFGNVGAAAGPYLIGAIGQRFGLERGIWLMPLFSLALALLSFGWFLRRREAVAV